MSDTLSTVLAGFACVAAEPDDSEGDDVSVASDVELSVVREPGGEPVGTLRCCRCFWSRHADADGEACLADLLFSLLIVSCDHIILLF